ncbi:citrate lyase holo-[acyl-carrier protein] synthase [uncultured Ilyobacter sp.]|uniref:citrate lyase holo-[acyl-carrier protein] synthase n=1 Tax=uncultured Ilyobacter sp. TaxID=544433 RepID=UPI0029F5006B|nr:citrate lyase holo-[acyl-carrier protein] synthase [uncultured Ilyobacter sp.]
MKKKNINPIDILNAREQRVRLQEALSKEYSLPFIALRTNYPGLDKNSFVANDIASIMNSECQRIFESKIRYTETLYSFEGVVYIIFIEEDPINIKKSVIKLEKNHPLGRLADIDVYRDDSQGISRSHLNLPKRKCFICENDAHICVRSRAHLLSELIEYIHVSYENFKKNEVKK